MTAEFEKEDLVEIIRAAGMERIADLAFRVAWGLRRIDFQNITDDRFIWPVAGEKSAFSLLDEIIWVSKENGGDQLLDNYRPFFRVRCEEIARNLAFEEKELVGTAILFEFERENFHSDTERRDAIAKCIEDEVLLILGNNDKDWMEENARALGLT